MGTKRRVLGSVTSVSHFELAPGYHLLNLTLQGMNIHPSYNPVSAIIGVAEGSLVAIKGANRTN